MGGFTKGPWLRSGTTVYALNARDFNRFCAQVQGAHTPDDELLAVATLMQAAPDLLEALERLVSAARDVDHGYMDQAIDSAEAAIARARGEA